MVKPVCIGLWGGTDSPPQTKDQDTKPQTETVRCTRYQELHSHFWGPHRRAHISRMLFLTSSREPWQELSPSSIFASPPCTRPTSSTWENPDTSSSEGPLAPAARPLCRAVPRPLTCLSQQSHYGGQRQAQPSPARPLNHPRAHTCNESLGLGWGQQPRTANKWDTHIKVRFLCQVCSLITSPRYPPLP